MGFLLDRLKSSRCIAVEHEKLEKILSPSDSEPERGSLCEVFMIDINKVVDTRKVFSSTNEDEIYESMIEKYVDGTLDSGGRFWGRLEAFNEQKLFIRGERGQAIIIKRRRISRLEAV
jgi:hypothetical protein